MLVLDELELGEPRRFDLYACMYTNVHMTKNAAKERVASRRDVTFIIACSLGESQRSITMFLYRRRYFATAIL